jgi:signal transduction histidine kinase
MTNTMSAIDTNGLRFFGRMSASISHDLKNTLSIMNESAGLLEDLALLAERGRPLDHRRIKDLGATIKRQIQRTDRIVRNMNQFSHSVDDAVKEIGLAVSLELLLAICQRLIDARGIKVAIKPCSPDIVIKTHPFFFLHLVWRLLEHCMTVAGPEKQIMLHIEQTPPVVHIAFKGLGSLATGSGLGEPLQDLLIRLDAGLELEIDHQMITLVLPQRIAVNIL